MSQKENTELSESCDVLKQTGTINSMKKARDPKADKANRNDQKNKW